MSKRAAFSYDLQHDLQQPCRGNGQQHSKKDTHKKQVKFYSDGESDEELHLGAASKPLRPAKPSAVAQMFKHKQHADFYEDEKDERRVDVFQDVSAASQLVAQSEYSQALSQNSEPPYSPLQRNNTQSQQPQQSQQQQQDWEG